MDFKVNFLLVIISIILLLSLVAAAPNGPDSITLNSNVTSTPTASKIINISGGYIASINISATVQNPRWKAFIGYVSGSFTLDDAIGSSIYDWTISSITGKVFATRNSTSVTWANINCSNFTTLNQENINLNHTNPNDNLTRTFNLTTGATHDLFYVGTRLISSNTCPTLNTYVNNATQDTDFQEIALYDGHNIVYTTIIENRTVGYNGQNYDFQMIVPEVGLSGFSGSTGYYLYVEID